MKTFKGLLCFLLVVTHLGASMRAETLTNIHVELDFDHYVSPRENQFVSNFVGRAGNAIPFGGIDNSGAAVPDPAWGFIETSFRSKFLATAGSKIIGSIAFQAPQATPSDSLLMILLENIKSSGPNPIYFQLQPRGAQKYIFQLHSGTTIGRIDFGPTVTLKPEWYRLDYNFQFTYGFQNAVSWEDLVAGFHLYSLGPEGTDEPVVVERFASTPVLHEFYGTEFVKATFIVRAPVIDNFMIDGITVAEPTVTPRTFSLSPPIPGWGISWNSVHGRQYRIERQGQVGAPWEQMNDVPASDSGPISHFFLTSIDTPLVRVREVLAEDGSSPGPEVKSTLYPALQTQLESIPDKIYVLERSDAINDRWISWGTSQAGTGGTLTFFAPIDANLRFFRVREFE